MAALAATSSATPSLQATLIKTRLQQARHDADQAEANAEDLRLQAQEQDRAEQMARQRIQTLEKQPPAAAIPAPTSSSPASTEVENLPTYEKTLAGVFGFSKPLLAMDLSATQKNVVTSSLFTAAAAAVAWRSSASSSDALQNYSKQGTESGAKTAGSVVDTTA